MSAAADDRTARLRAPGPARSAPQVTVHVRALSDMGLVRTNNEDAFLVQDLSAAPGAPPPAEEPIPLGPRGFLLAVSDGMGGSEAGEVASRIAVETLARVLREEWSARSERTDLAELRNDLRTAVLRAHRAVVDDAHANPGRSGMGATLTAAVIHGGHVLVAHVGDSRCYLLRSGVLKCLTSDQSLAEELVRRGIVERGSAAYDARRNMLTRVVGQMGRLEPDAEAAALAAGDVLLLCSDGLHGPVDDEVIAATLGGEGSPAAMAASLVEAARRNGAPDNVTCVVARVDGPGLPDASTAEAGGATVSVLLDPTAVRAAEKTAAIALQRPDTTAEYTASQFEADDTLAAVIAPGAHAARRPGAAARGDGGDVGGGPAPARPPAGGHDATEGRGDPHGDVHGGGHGHGHGAVDVADTAAPWKPDPEWGPGARQWLALLVMTGAMLVARMLVS